MTGRASDILITPFELAMTVCFSGSEHGAKRFSKI